MTLIKVAVALFTMTKQKCVYGILQITHFILLLPTGSNEICTCCANFTWHSLRQRRKICDEKKRGENIGFPTYFVERIPIYHVLSTFLDGK